MEITEEGIQFSDVDRAYMWSQEVLSRPDVKGMFHTILPKGGTGVPRDELVDTAHTISVAASNIEQPFAGRVYQHLMGDALPAREEQIVATLTDWIESCPDVTKKRRRDQREAIARLSLASKRQELAEGKDPVPPPKYAKALGVDRRRIWDSGWMSLISYAHECIYSQYRIARNDLEVQLRDRGFIPNS